MISIHVPLAGDDREFYSMLVRLKISIHVPLAGDDSRTAQNAALKYVQSNEFFKFFSQPPFFTPEFLAKNSFLRFGHGANLTQNR